MTLVVVHDASVVSEGVFSTVAVRVPSAVVDVKLSVVAEKLSSVDRDVSTVAEPVSERVSDVDDDSSETLVVVPSVAASVSVVPEGVSTVVDVASGGWSLSVLVEEVLPQTIFDSVGSSTDAMDPDGAGEGPLLPVPRCIVVLKGGVYVGYGILYPPLGEPPGCPW